MSRLPFSQLYDVLTEEEQRVFDEFFAPHVRFFKSNEFKLREYQHPDADALANITLFNWFKSIINKKARIKDEQNRDVDILSPPPKPAGTPDSMGAYDIGQTGNLSLIEARGYSGIYYKNKRLTFDKLSEFIMNESQWFFNIQQ